MPALSKMLGGAVLFIATLVPAQAKYAIVDEFTPGNFFESFDFFTEADPTHGFVKYLAAEQANDNSRAGFWNNGVMLGLDYQTQNPPNGRESTRVVSKKAWTHGLFVADISHMPGNTCGIWPAYWLVGPDWPAGGEIDIIEGVNTQTSTAITLHTAEGCVITNEGTLGTTKLNSGNCNENTAFTGCGQETADNQNYGDGFNANNGGVYATQWTKDHIAIWFFPRNSIPEDITSDAPNPDSWGKPIAKFNGGGGCDIDSYFKEHKIVINTTFCGDWAGNVWEQNDECKALAPTCEEYVANHPDVYAQAYWLVNKIQVYQN